MVIDELKAEIEKLDPRAFSELRFWMNTHDDDEWDRQMEEDAASGALDAAFGEMAARASEDHRRGLTRPLPTERDTDATDAA